jgi:hypothetical protein
MVGAKQRLRPSDSELLERVDTLLPLVVPLAGVAFRVLVRKDAAGRLEHRARRVVLGRDEADLVEFPALFGSDERGNFRIGLGQMRVDHGHSTGP